MLTADIVRPSDLGPLDRAAWSALRDQAETFQSPLFSLEFTEAVAEVRPDVAVAVLRQGGRAIGFLPHHRRPGGLARPVGAPFSDYHGLIGEPGIDGFSLLRLAGLKEYRFTALVDPHGAFRSAGGELQESYGIALPAGERAGAEHLERIRAGSPKRFKNLRRLDHKLEREVGPIAITAPDRDPQTFDLMFSWKRAQFERSGLHDVFAPAWSRALMRRLFQRSEGRLRGLMVTLSVADRPAVMHFGVREGDRFHPWVASQDEALAAYSPGQIMLWRAVEAMPGLGLRSYDLAGGHDHYKTPFATHTVQVSAGSAAVRAGMEALAWRLAETHLGQGLAGRVRRRIEQIASVELTPTGRVAGFIGAVRGQSRRRAQRAAIPAPGAC